MVTIVPGAHDETIKERIEREYLFSFQFSSTMWAPDSACMCVSYITMCL